MLCPTCDFSQAGGLCSALSRLSAGFPGPFLPRPRMISWFSFFSRFVPPRQHLREPGHEHAQLRASPPCRGRSLRNDSQRSSARVGHYRQPLLAASADARRRGYQVTLAKGWQPHRSADYERSSLPPATPTTILYQERILSIGLSLTDCHE